MVNKNRPHVLVLPEDDANRQLANGFWLELASPRQMQVLPVAGGWKKVLDCFDSDHKGYMDKYPNRSMILLIDFDDQKDRLDIAKASIHAHLIDRVFVLGVWSEPEKLPRDLGHLETIGRAMARDCREGTRTCWEHDLLRHNAGELERMRERVRPLLFV
jgi:hypothetical protein